ncbi:unnamed protein product [Chrysoparadoxa australica]
MRLGLLQHSSRAARASCKGMCTSAKASPVKAPRPPLLDQSKIDLTEVDPEIRDKLDKKYITRSKKDKSKWTDTQYRLEKNEYDKKMWVLRQSFREETAARFAREKKELATKREHQLREKRARDRIKATRKAINKARHDVEAAKARERYQAGWERSKSFINKMRDIAMDTNVAVVEALEEESHLWLKTEEEVDAAVINKLWQQPANTATPLPTDPNAPYFGSGMPGSHLWRFTADTGLGDADEAAAFDHAVVSPAQEKMMLRQAATQAALAKAFQASDVPNDVRDLDGKMDMLYQPIESLEEWEQLQDTAAERALHLDDDGLPPLAEGGWIAKAKDTPEPHQDPEVLSRLLQERQEQGKDKDPGSGQGAP